MGLSKCAHKIIEGKTTEADKNGYRKDYWECASCGREVKIRLMTKREYPEGDSEPADPPTLRRI